MNLIHRKLQQVMATFLLASNKNECFQKRK